MQPKTSTLERWQFSAAVLLPVVLALVITAAAVLGFVFWSTANIDERALERQNAMVAQVIEAHRTQLEHELASVAVSDETVVNTRLMFNFNWADRNLGKWMHEFFGHNRIVVLDALAQPLYMMQDGVSVPPETYRGISSPVQQLVNRVRAATPPTIVPGTQPRPVSVSDFAVVEGQPAIVSVMTIVSDSGAIMQAPGTEPLIAAVQFLDDDTASRFNNE